MAETAKMLERHSEKEGMVELTELLMKTVLAWMSYISRLSAGRVLLGALKYKDSPVRCKDSVPEKAYLLQRHHLPTKQRNTLL